MKIKVVTKGTVKAKPSNYCVTFLDDASFPDADEVADNGGCVRSGSWPA